MYHMTPKNIKCGLKLNEILLIYYIINDIFHKSGIPVFAYLLGLRNFERYSFETPQREKNYIANVRR